MKKKLAKNEPAETAASMTIDALHRRCVSGAGRISREFKQTYRKIKPDLLYIAEMRNRFAALPRGNANIKGCKTWTEYVRQHLNRSERQIRNVLSGLRSASLVPETETDGVRVPPSVEQVTRVSGEQVTRNGVPLLLETVTTEHFNKPPISWLNDDDKPRVEPAEPKPTTFFELQHAERVEPSEQTEIVLHTEPIPPPAETEQTPEPEHKYAKLTEGLEKIFGQHQVSIVDSVQTRFGYHTVAYGRLKVSFLTRPNELEGFLADALKFYSEKFPAKHAAQEEARKARQTRKERKAAKRDGHHIN